MENKKAISDVRLEEDLSFADQIPAGESYYEVNGVLILGEAHGNDIALISLVMHAGGGRDGVWQVEEGFLNQTTLVILPQDQQGTMQDNETIGNRSYITEWAPIDNPIMRKGDEIIWQIGKMQHISRPPYWEVKGEHMGVECDLMLRGTGNAARTFGNWEGLAETGHAGYDQPCRAEGTITARGVTYTLENAYAIHEKLMLSKGWNLVELFRQDNYYWIWCISDDVRVSVSIQPNMAIQYAHAHVEGKEIFYSQDQITLTPLEWWIDPQTLMQVPHRWHLNMSSEHGVMDMMMAARGRCLFGYLTRTGATTHYGNVGRSNGRFFLPDGRNIPMTNAQTWVEWGRCAMPLPSGR